MPWALVRAVSDLPFSVMVAVLMRLPELLAVGVVPPPVPYLPPPYPLPLLPLVWVVPPDGEVVPDSLVLLPQAARMTTSVANISILHQVRPLACEVKRVLRIMFSSFASGETSSGGTFNENESQYDLMLYTY
jgi:hypothetical protein